MIESMLISVLNFIAPSAPAYKEPSRYMKPEYYFLTVAIICGFFIITQWTLFILARHRLSAIINEVTSVEVIGSADGPTSIYISQSDNRLSIVLLILVHIAFLYSVGFLVARKIQRNNRN